MMTPERIYDLIMEELQESARNKAELDKSHDCNSCWGDDYGLGEGWR